MTAEQAFKRHYQQAWLEHSELEGWAIMYELGPDLGSGYGLAFGKNPSNAWVVACRREGINPRTGTRTPDPESKEGGK